MKKYIGSFFGNNDDVMHGLEERLERKRSEEQVLCYIDNKEKLYTEYYSNLQKVCDYIEIEGIDVLHINMSEYLYTFLSEFQGTEYNYVDLPSGTQKVFVEKNLLAYEFEIVGTDGMSFSILHNSVISK